MQQQDPKNLILAMALSLLVIVGWNYFYGAPKVKQARQTESQLEQINPASQAKPSNPAESAAAGAPGAANPVAPDQPLNRADALLQSPRISSTPRACSAPSPSKARGSTTSN